MWVNLASKFSGKHYGELGIWYLVVDRVLRFHDPASLPSWSLGPPKIGCRSISTGRILDKKSKTDLSSWWNLASVNRSIDWTVSQAETSITIDNIVFAARLSTQLSTAGAFLMEGMKVNKLRCRMLWNPLPPSAGALKWRAFWHYPAFSLATLDIRNEVQTCSTHIPSILNVRWALNWTVQFLGWV